jgi:hypothetical protein
MDFVSHFQLLAIDIDTIIHCWFEVADTLGPDAWKFVVGCFALLSPHD